MHSNSNSSFETLESRRMLSASLNSGFLSINGTNAADQISVSETFRSVRVNGQLRLERFLRVTETTGQTTQTSEFRAANVARIDLNSFGGDDVITLNTLTGANVYAGAGNDRITSGSGADFLYGDMSFLNEIGMVDFGPGNDVIQGNAGNDYIEGNGGNDELRGGAGNDIITGGAGVDRMFGEAGNDTFFAKDGSIDSVDGGAGTDTAQIDDFLRRITSGPLAGAFIRIRDAVAGVETVTN